MPEPPTLDRFNVQMWRQRADGPSMVDGNTSNGPPSWAMQSWSYPGAWRELETQAHDQFMDATNVEIPVLKEGRTYWA